MPLLLVHTITGNVSYNITGKSLPDGFHQTLPAAVCASLDEPAKQQINQGMIGPLKGIFHFSIPICFNDWKTTSS